MKINILIHELLFFLRKCLYLYKKKDNMRGVKRTKEIFIEDAIKVHGDKYDYSKVDYINTDAKVIIK